MREITLGQYYPVNSVLHRMDPRIKILLTVIYITMIFFIQTYIAYAVAFLTLFLIVGLSKVPPLKVLKSLKMVLFLIIFTIVISILFYAGKGETPLWSFGIIKIYKSGLINASKMTLRLILLVLGPTILTFTTTPVELTDGLERLLKPLNLIKFPVHEMAIIMSMALRLIPTLVEETDKIKSAQKARLADFDSGNIFKRAKAMIPILIPLFVSSFRRADDLADAMDSRCYRGAKGRTRMKIMKVKLRDILALIVMALVFFVILWMRYNFMPFLVDWSALGWFI